MKKTTTIIILVIAIILLAICVFKCFMGSNSSVTGAPATSENATTSTEAMAASNTVTYSCKEGKKIVAIYHQGEMATTTEPGQPPMPTGSVDLTLNDGSKMTLMQTISADGTRYSNADESFVFWGKGNGAIVLENGEEKNYSGCVGDIQEE